MRRKLLVLAAIVLLAPALTLAGMILLIRSGLQGISDKAMAQFPGSRSEALMRMVDCDSCSLEDRNHAVWALGQMVEVRAISVLSKHFDGRPCTHTSRLCQYELRKAIRLIETRHQRVGPIWHLAGRWHQPWH